MSKKCTPLWREARAHVKMYKTHHSPTTFGSWDVEKVHAIVARSTLPGQNVQSTPFSDHFWKLRSRKSACPRGAKNISKAKCTKHHVYGPLLEVEMLFCVAGAKDCAPCQKWAEHGFCSSFNYNYNYIRYTTLHYIILHHTHSTTQTTWHPITLHYIALRSTTLHYTTPHYTTLHYATQH